MLDKINASTTMDVSNETGNRTGLARPDDAMSCALSEDGGPWRLAFPKVGHLTKYFLNNYRVLSSIL